MLRKYWIFIVFFGVLILIFPVSLTLITNKISDHHQGEIKPLGKTVVIENDKYEMEMDVESFIPCVLMAQMPIDSPIELLKAQSVVIRTYILKQMGENKKIGTKKLVLPYITYAQMEDMWFYQFKMKNVTSFWGIFGNLTGIGKNKIFHENMAYLNKAIGKTSHKVLKDGGKMILPLFHQMSAGTTRDGKNILGKDYAYLKSVNCNTDMQEENYIGVRFFTPKQFCEQLKNSGIIIYKDQKEVFLTDDLDLQEFIKMIDCSNKDKSGYVLFVKIGDTKIGADVFIKALDLNSANFEISEYEKGIRITTKGVGHGFGMSLCYAKQLAKKGKNWKEILKNFYQAVIVE